MALYQQRSHTHASRVHPSHHRQGRPYPSDNRLGVHIHLNTAMAMHLMEEQRGVSRGRTKNVNATAARVHLYMACGT